MQEVPKRGQQKVRPGRFPVIRKRGERGNNAIELPLILVPFLALVFAICDFGLAVFIQNTVQNAAREGVRYAITYQTITGSCQDASIKQVVQNNSMGFVSNPALITVNYYAPADLSSPVAAPNGNLPGNVVEVSVQNLQRQWIAPLMRSPGSYNIGGWSSDVMQGLATGSNPPCR